MTRLFAAAALALFFAAAPASGAAAKSCPDFAFERNGVPWAAEEIRVADVTCARARRVIRAYAKPRNCRFVAPCNVKGLTCETIFARGSEFAEDCTSGDRRVRWAGSYESS